MKFLTVVLVAALALVGCSVGQSEITSPPGTVGVAVNEQGIVTAEVAIGTGEPVPVQVDTGSAGLRIFSESVPEGQAKSTGATTELEFGDGSIYHGSVAKAKVNIGSVTSDSELLIQVVDQVSCGSTQPGTECISDINAIVRDQGIHGILGIATAPDDAFISNPLPFVSEEFRQYTVSVSKDSGIIKPGAASEETNVDYGLTEYQVHGDPQPATNTKFWESSVTGCWGFGTEKPACDSTLFDPGTNSMVVPVNLPGSPVTTAGQIGDGAGVLSYYGKKAAKKSPEPLWTVTSGGTVSNIVLASSGGGDPSVVASVPFLLDHPVHYDLVNGKMTILN